MTLYAVARGSRRGHPPRLLTLTTFSGDRMTRSAPGLSSLGQLTVVIFVAGLAACAKESDRDGQPSAQSAAVRYGRVVGEQDDEIPVRKTQFGSLGGAFQPPAQEVADPQRETPAPSKHVEDMTDAELVTYLNTLVYDMSLDHSELALLPCKKPGTATCPFDEYAKAYIQPEAGMNRRGIDNIPANGLVVARLINYSQGADSAENIGLPPAQRAWWYVDSSGNKLRSRYFVRTYSSSGKGAKFIGPNRVFKDCKHDPVRDRPAIAKWRSCEDDGGFARSIAPQPVRKVSSLFHAVRLQVDSSQDSTAIRRIRGETWITCSLGCCIGG